MFLLMVGYLKREERQLGLNIFLVTLNELKQALVINHNNNDKPLIILTQGSNIQSRLETKIIGHRNGYTVLSSNLQGLIDRGPAAYQRGAA